jgi:hypothetical protein
MQTWYHVARTPEGYYVHRLDPIKVDARADALRKADPDLPEDKAVSEAIGEYVEAIRDGLGFAPRGRWLDRPGWASHISPGEPHPEMMATQLNPNIDDLPQLGPVPGESVT